MRLLQHSDGHWDGGPHRRVLRRVGGTGTAESTFDRSTTVFDGSVITTATALRALSALAELK